MQVWKAGVIYFGFVFTAGFVLGPIRNTWLVPRFGERFAELMEMPVMLAIVVTAARWVVRHHPRIRAASHRLQIGCIGVTLLLIAEFSLVVPLRGMSIREYLASRDPVAGSVYYAMLGLFAIMPALIRPASPSTLSQDT